MIVKTGYWRRGLALAGALLGLGISGCSAMPFGGASAPQASATAPPPMVQNCGIVSIGSPSNYACDGKVYTAFQLAKLRQDWEKSHGG